LEHRAASSWRIAGGEHR